MVDGHGVPTPFDTWIAESLAVEDPNLFERQTGHQWQDERTQVVKTRVLIAEDDEDTREVIAFYLSSLGYEPVTAASGKTALEMAKQRRPDILLTDIQMPDVDGLELIRRLRSDQELSALPILAVTAYGAETLEKALAVGADACLAKPLNFANLAQTIEAILGQADGRS
jgi:two-component system cell cycle response regulator DivK